jgi:lipoate-protein ligase A
MSTARLIIDPPARGTWNMAVDEALLEAASAGVTTLRFYQWSEPTLSLGYFQAAAERASHPASRDCPLVRRASGGGAIVHDRELTYSFAAPIRERFGAEPAAIFEALHGSLVLALKDLGIKATAYKAPAKVQVHRPEEPFLCFERRASGDLLCGQHKIAGSAQRRQRGGLLQHGSILLARSASAPELPGIGEIAGLTISAVELAAAWQPRLATALGISLKPAELSPAERIRTAEIESSRFASEAWTLRR